MCTPGSIASLPDTRLSHAHAQVVVHFWAEWCAPCKQMDAVMRTLADEHAHAGFFRVDAEALPELTDKYHVSVVPSFVVLKVREARLGSWSSGIHTCSGQVRNCNCLAADSLWRPTATVGRSGLCPQALHSPCRELCVQVKHMLNHMLARLSGS